MNQKLTHTKEDKGETQGGIPMRKSGNRFVVKVNINNDISLNLLLDTGASRTAVSMKTLASMQRAKSSSSLRSFSRDPGVNYSNNGSTQKKRGDDMRRCGDDVCRRLLLK